MADTLAAAMLCVAVFCFSGCAASQAHAEMASRYGRKCGQRRTADGHSHEPSGLTAAHRALLFGTVMRVTKLRDGRSVVVRIEDRGPLVRGRDIDLSLTACRAVGNSGIARVCLDYVSRHGDFGAF
jgi:peptidoglycan lytic transglycosylase